MSGTATCDGRAGVKSGRESVVGGAMGERAAMAAVWWMMGGGTLAAHHRAGSKRMSQIVEPHFLMVGAA